MAPETRHAPKAPDAPPAAPRRPQRVAVLAAMGLLLVLAALALRFSPWAREYQLRHTSLERLRLMATASPKDPLVFYYMGTQAYNAHSLGEAGYSFQHAVELDPKLARAWIGLAVVQRDLDHWMEAYSSAKQAQTLNPHDVDTQFMVGLLVMHQSKGDAVREFQKVTRMAPRRADGWYLLGTCQDEIHQAGDAIPPLRKAVALDPKNAVYRRDLGKVLLEMNLFDAARPELEKAIRLDPRDGQTLFYYGQLLLKTALNDEQLRQADAALDKCQFLLAQTPQPDATTAAAAAAARASAAMRLREPQRAIAQLERQHQLDPSNIQYLYEKASALRMSGREAEARALMDRYTRLSAVSSAIEQMMERVRQDPKNPALRLRMARLFEQGKDYARAANQYEYCLYLDPKQAEARRELEALQQTHKTAGPAPSTAKSGAGPQKPRP